MAEGLFGRLGGRGQSSARRHTGKDVRGGAERRGMAPAGSTRSSTGYCASTAPSAPAPARSTSNTIPGVYHCAGCGQPLFEAGTKFNSRTGWPSFWAPLEDAVETTPTAAFS